jgi:hypothetical protein
MRLGTKHPFGAIAVLAAAASAALVVALRVHGPSAAPGPLAVAAASAAAPRVPDGCDLLPGSRVEAILGEAVAPPRLRAGTCEYRRAGDAEGRLDTPVIGVRLYRSITREAFEAEVDRSAALFGGPKQAVASLGDEAFRVGTVALSVRARAAAVTILCGDPTIADATIDALAREAAQRLP